MAPATCTVPENAITQCQFLVVSYIAPAIGGPNNSPMNVEQTTDGVREPVYLPGAAKRNKSPDNPARFSVP